MRPLKLRMAGLRSWRREQELSFRDVDLAAVVGPTGAGKSSILEAIVYALYNATTYDARGVRSLISSDESTVSVAFDFEADGEEWRVTRSTSQGSYPPSVHKLTCLTDPARHPIVEGRTEVNAAVSRLLGLDYDQFISAVLLPQGRFQRLITATDGERTGILKGVFRLDELAATRERAAELRRTEVDPALDAAHDERAMLLGDPAAELADAGGLLAQAEATVAALAGFAQTRDEHAEHARELDLAAAAADRAAQKLDDGMAAVPPLDDVIAVAAKLAGQETALAQERDAVTQERERARTAVRAAADDGRSVAGLAAASQALADAADALPAQAARATALASEHDALAAREADLAQARGVLETDVGAVEDLRRHRASADADRDRAHVRLHDARAALADARAAVLAEDTATQTEVAAERLLGEAQTAAELTQTAADDAAADLAAAQCARDELRRDHEAAHLAAGLRPGDPCPVCRTAVPVGFAPAPPHPGLPAAETTLLARGQADELARAAAVAARTRLSTQQGVYDEARAAQRDASAASALAQLALTDAGIGGALSSDDEILLAAEVEAAAAADGRARHAADALARHEAQIDATASDLARRAVELQAHGSALATQVAAFERERAAMLERVQRLPATLRPASMTEAGLTSAGRLAAGALAEVQQLVEDEQIASRRLDDLAEALAALASNRTDRVDGPRREAMRHADGLVAQLLAVDAPPPLPTRPVDAAALEQQNAWVTAIGAVSRATIEALRADAKRMTGARERAQTAARDTLREAGELLGERLGDSHALGARLDAHRAIRLDAARRVRRAEEELPKVAALVARVEGLRQRRAALDELCRLLNDGQFVGWLVARRQRHLLAVASEILAGMTAERYRFAADFAVVDGRSGQPRSAKTLSGGETFLASMALALGMAELAARNGGRIGSLYLDEGFGSLDPNALDEAIEALQARARAGQMILVISHVPAVAQRIDRVLQVQPSPVGSTARWLQDADRDALVLEGAAE